MTLDERDALIVGNLPAVKYIAGRIARGMPFHFNREDMIGVGNLALVRAAERYQPDHGATFRTYAEHVVHGAIIDSLRKRNFRANTMQSIDDLRPRLRTKPELDEAIDGQRFEKRLAKVITALPPKQREVVALRYGGDTILSFAQMAVELKAKECTLYFRHSTAIRSLRARLKIAA